MVFVARFATESKPRRACPALPSHTAASAVALSRPRLSYSSRAGRVDGGVEGEPSQVARLSWIDPGIPSHFGVPERPVGACAAPAGAGLCGNKSHQSSTDCSWARHQHSLGHLTCQTRASTLLHSWCVVWKSLLVVMQGSCLQCEPLGFASFLTATGPHIPRWPLGVWAEFLGPELLAPSCDVSGPQSFLKRRVSGLAGTNISPTPGSICTLQAQRG